MNVRINWIDWAKAFCITVVVFCHLPQKGDNFYLQYLASVILSTFFFISGYLKKQNLSAKESAKKYANSLLIPYIIYNVLYYPYWLAKFFIEHGYLAWSDACKPIIGALLGQLNSPISCELNGVTWFLIALFMMHILTDSLNKSKHGKNMMLILSTITIILYGTNKYYHYAPYITYHGFVRCLCFFFLGNLFQQWNYLKSMYKIKDLAIGITSLLLSLCLFYWHINEYRFTLHIVLYYIVNLFSIFAFIYLSKSLNNIQLHIITYISTGTMLIFGLHRIIIGIIDYIFEKAFLIIDNYFNWHEAIIISIVIDITLIPAIIWGQKYIPFIFGKKI